jgi:hypothetical protein
MRPVRQRLGRAAFLALAAWGLYRNDPTLTAMGLIGTLWLYSLAVWVTAYTSRRPPPVAEDSSEGAVESETYEPPRVPKEWGYSRQTTR